MAKREDLRHLSVCSVDPPGCTDIDDALHCRELENGNLEVHKIHFIKWFFVSRMKCVCGWRLGSTLLMSATSSDLEQL